MLSCTANPKRADVQIVQCHGSTGQNPTKPAFSLTLSPRKQYIYTTIIITVDLHDAEGNRLG